MKSKFFKIFKIVVILLLLVIIIVWAILFLFLSSYEKSIPTHKVDEVITWMKKNNVDKILNYLKVDNEELNTKDSLKEIIKFNNDDYYYIKDTLKSKKTSLVYNVYCNSKNIGTIYLQIEDKKGSFNLDRWKINYLEGFLNDKKDISIIAPSNSKIYVNGYLLDDTYIENNDYKNEKMEYMSPYVTMDKLIKLNVKDVYNPHVKVVYNNDEKELTSNDNTYTYIYGENLEVLNSQKEYIENFLKNYTRYVLKETTFSSITPYMITNSNAYSFLRYIALTNLWSGDHYAIQFEDFNYSNMQYYNDKAFSVNVKYKYNYVVINSDKKELEANIMLYMVKQNDKWYVVGLNT